MNFEPMSHYEELRMKIAYYRKKQGLTQSEVADKMGISRSSYAYTESKASRLSPDFLVKLAAVLKIPANLLTDGQASTTEESLGGGNIGNNSSDITLSKKEERIIKMLRMLSDTSYSKVYNLLRNEYEENMEED